MRKLSLPIFFLLILSACSTAPERKPGDTFYPTPSATADTSANAEVTRVSDGDTITVRFLDSGDQEKVRLATIDAPENGQPFSAQSKKSLSDLVMGKRVRVEEIDRDRYGRIVAEVFAEGLNVNLEQIRRGYAWHFKQYQGQQSEEMRNRYARTEESARQARNGLWRMPNPEPPWEWRKK